MDLLGLLDILYKAAVVVVCSWNPAGPKRAISAELVERELRFDECSTDESACAQQDCSLAVFSLQHHSGTQKHLRAVLSVRHM